MKCANCGKEILPRDVKVFHGVVVPCKACVEELKKKIKEYPKKDYRKKK